MAQVGNIIFSISADLKNLQGQLRTMEGNFTSSFSRIEGLAGTLGKGILQGLVAGFSVAAITGFAKEVVDLAGKLQDLSEQTGISAQTLSGIKSTLDESGTSLDAFATGIFKAQKELGEVTKASDPAARAIQQLGLNLDELRNASPDKFLELVTDALAKVENPMNRAALGAGLLGKQYRELAPAINVLAGRLDELRKSGISNEDIATLDRAGDAWTKFANTIKIASAGVFADALRDLENIYRLVRLNLGALQSAGATGMMVGGGMKDVLAGAAKPGTGQVAPFRALPTTGDVQKIKNEVDNFLDGLSKQLDTINAKKIEFKFGTDAGLGASLDAQFERFKDNLRDKQLPIPKGLEEFFKSLKERILASNEELKRMQFEMARIDELAKALSQDSAEWLTVTEDLAKKAADELAKIEPKFRDLQKTLAVEILPPDDRKGGASIQEFEDRVKAINEWRDAAIAAGQDVEAANAKAAQATADAWVAMGEKMQDTADQASEFTRRAFERGFDAVSDALEGFLNDGFTSFEDFGKKILRVINSLLADQLTLQLKDLVLGTQTGTSKGGGQIGGILGPILESLGLQKPAGQSQRIPGVTGRDIEDAELGEKMSQSAMAAIETGSATAEAAIQAVSAQGQATLQASLTATQAGITAMETTGIASIQGVEAVAIAAIEAALSRTSGSSGSGGMGIPFLDMFSGGGGAESSIGGAFDVENLMWGASAVAHRGGRIGSALPKRYGFKMHSGGEVPVIARSGEYMLNEWSASSLGKQNLDFMNRTGTMPGVGADRRPIQVNISTPDAGSFQRSKRAVARQLQSAMKRND